MNAYVYRADLHCEPCAKLIMSQRAGNVADYEDSEDYPQGPYTQGGGESDAPQHCGTCGEFLENPLTDDGRAYVAIAVEEAKLDKRYKFSTAQMWERFYGLVAA